MVAADCGVAVSGFVSTNSWNIQPHGSMPASAFRINPNVDLVAELPEYRTVDAPSTQLSVLELRGVDHGYSPPRPWPAVGISTVARVAEPFPINLKGPDDESVADLAVNAEDGSWHVVGSASPDIKQAREIPVHFDVLEGCAVGRQSQVELSSLVGHILERSRYRMSSTDGFTLQMRVAMYGTISITVALFMNRWAFDFRCTPQSESYRTWNCDDYQTSEQMGDFLRT